MKNNTSKPITILLAGNIPNFIGFDGKVGKNYENSNTNKEENCLKGIHFTANEEITKDSAQWGPLV